MTRKIWENLRSVLVIIGLIWFCYFTSKLFNPATFALQPRQLVGLRGLLFMPLVHADLNQVFSNTLPLTSLLLMLRFSTRKFWRTLLVLSLCSGLLLWLFGLSQDYLGANMLIYALAAWLITTGFVQRRLLSVAAAVLVTVSFGELFWQMFPTAGTHVVWESHLLGAVAGTALAWRNRAPVVSPQQSHAPLPTAASSTTAVSQTPPELPSPPSAAPEASALAELPQASGMFTPIAADFKEPAEDDPSAEDFAI